MKDVFQNYHKHKVLSNLGLLSLSAILALSINSFVLNGNIGDTIKASVLEAWVQWTKDLDFKVQALNSSLVFQNNKDMKQVRKISFSLAYNPEILELSPNENVIFTNNGLAQYNILFDTPTDISAGTEIFIQKFKKLKEDTVYLNIANVQFIDSSENTFRLSTSSIIF